MSIPHRLHWIVVVAAAIVLSGCATSRIVENDVQTFSQLRTLPTPATYRIDRLPSQEAAPLAQSQLEEAAAPALAKAGWVRDDRAARYSVLIGTSVQTRVQVYDPWPYGPHGWGGFHGRRGYRGGFYVAYWGGAWPYGYQRSYAQRQVSVVIRDLSNQQVVYETRAVHAGPSRSDFALLTTMFDAAFSGFPQPGSGMRRVTIESPPRSSREGPATGRPSS